MDKYCVIHLYEVPRRSQIYRDRKGLSKRNGHECLIRTEFSLGMMEDSGDGWLYSSVNELNTVRKQDTVGPSWGKHPAPSPPSSLSAEKH